MTAWINLGSTPSRSPARRIIESRFGSPDVGISEASNCVTFLAGAKAELIKTPVRFVNTKAAMTAKGANLIERKWGNCKGNFIQYSPCATRQAELYDILHYRMFLGIMDKGTNQSSDLEAATEMELIPKRLLFCSQIFAAKPLSYMYLIDSIPRSVCLILST